MKESLFMTQLIPASHQDLLEKPLYAVVTTVMPDGQPQSTVVWVDADDLYVRINSARGRQKDKNLLNNPKVTVLILDPQNAFRWLEVRGVVEEATTEGAVDHINALSVKYTGQTYFGGFNTRETADTQTRVMYKIRPTKVTAFPGS
jgi:PPOX class probable F420-dependent enzyme